LLRNVISSEGHIPCRRGIPEPTFSCEKALPQRGWVQRLARLCTQSVKKRSVTIHYEPFCCSGFFRRHFGNPPLPWFNSLAEGELTAQLDHPV
jgi:methylphosphotriester-DNA--protein-cysteine methyltransferase